MNINSNMLLKNLYMMVIFFSMSGPVLAVSSEDEDYVPRLETDNWQKVSDSHLAFSRGGFILPNGVVVDISFEKLLFRNGEETASSFFETADNQYLVDNGKLNIPGLSDDLFQSVIQNDLDNQTLQTINNINIDIKNLSNINLTPNSSQFYNLHSLPLTIN